MKAGTAAGAIETIDVTIGRIEAHRDQELGAEAAREYAAVHRVFVLYRRADGGVCRRA